jgi:large subunit ribosomal protein L10
MERQQKIETVGQLRERLGRAASVVLVDYRGIKVEEVNGLRRSFRAAKCEYRVVKNTLLRIAVAGTPMEKIVPRLEGPTAIAFSFEDPGAVAKVATKTAKELPKFVIKGGYADGQLLDAAGVDALSKLPGREELRAKFLATLKAPVQNFVALLAAAPTNLLLLLQARERALGEAK